MERFWSKVNKSSNKFGADNTFPTECWEWTASLWGRGYGQLAIDGRPVSAHRISWELHFGELKQSICVLHKCDNRKCVRPDHLFLGTVRDNNLDKCRKGRASGGAVGTSNHSTCLSNQDVIQIRVDHQNGITRKSLAKRHQMSESAINKIVYGYTWRHLL